MRLSEGSRRLLGAAIGAGAGAAVFYGLATNNVHAVAVPGIGLGMGIGWLAHRRSLLMGLVAAPLSVLYSVAAELWFHPFSASQSIGEYVNGLEAQPLKAYLNLAVPLVVGFYFGMGRNRTTEQQAAG